MPHTTPLPGQTAPAIAADTIGQAPAAAVAHPKFDVVFFYRGVHCPVCRRQLEELARRKGEFEALGVSVRAVSMDSRERAERQLAEWDIQGLPLAYGLTEASAREWGLFVSGKAKDAEPDRFSEPGIAILYPDGTIYALYLQSVPFARPTLDGLLQGLKFVIENDYPARGSLAA